MALRPGSEFNAHGVMTPQRQLELETLAVNGGSVASMFAISAERAGLTPKGREAQRERERHRETMRVIMASEERIAEFRRELDRLERASYEALIQTEEDLRKAKDEQQRILDNAFRITMPDGKEVRVFPDKDGNVWDEHDNIVGHDVIKAKDIPAYAPRREQWMQNRADVGGLETRRSTLIELQKDLQEANEETNDGAISADEMAEFKARIGRHTPADLAENSGSKERAMDEPHSRQEITRPGPDVSIPGPG